MHAHMVIKVYSSLISIIFWPHCGAFGILVPHPGIEPVPLGVKTLSPNHQTRREFPVYNSLYPLNPTS